MEGSGRSAFLRLLPLLQNTYLKFDQVDLTGNAYLSFIARARNSETVNASRDRSAEIYRRRLLLLQRNKVH